MKWLFWVLVALLLIVRLPSLAQPAGGDQGIYSYVGQAIARGEVPYRDAWDQKPPGIHLTYALMFGLWRNEAVVAGTDLGVAALVAWLLVLVGRPFSRQGWEGHLAAALFLGLGNPAFLRLSGMWVRAQCETFIGLAVTAGVLALLRAGSVPVVDPRGRTSNLRLWSAGGGLLLGIAFVYKYNTLVYTALAAVMVVVAPSQGLWRSTGESIRERARRVLVPAAVAFVVPVSLVLLWLAQAGALNDFYQATIVYNLDYSGETYASALAVLRYLLIFPVRQSAVDPLWLLGGLGTAALLVAAVRAPALVIVPAWVAATCLSITVNGSRGLPQDLRPGGSRTRSCRRDRRGHRMGRPGAVETGRGVAGGSPADCRRCPCRDVRQTGGQHAVRCPLSAGRDVAAGLSGPVRRAEAD